MQQLLAVQVILLLRCCGVWWKALDDRKARLARLSLANDLVSGEPTAPTDDSCTAGEEMSDSVLQCLHKPLHSAKNALKCDHVLRSNLACAVILV